ncbi:LysR family transcriptional regulator [Acidocella sp.]|jgi:hypothetical protein|uniref:LysR family transcriptional regulator n=1 Tax=Acidocella sp. TaxID=50710 RepID=UPI002F421918
MELHQLRAFEVMAEESHFARAADRLGTTQSSVSRAIMALEAALGTRHPLTRRGRGFHTENPRTGPRFPDRSDRGGSRARLWPDARVDEQPPYPGRGFAAYRGHRSKLRFGDGVSTCRNLASDSRIRDMRHESRSRSLKLTEPALDICFSEQLHPIE